MPWNGDTDNMIDRFDCRVHLDSIDMPQKKGKLLVNFEFALIDTIVVYLNILYYINCKLNSLSIDWILCNKKIFYANLCILC